MAEMIGLLEGVRKMVDIQNELIRENEVLRKQGVSGNAGDLPLAVPFRDFAAAASAALNTQVSGWFTVYEQQIGLREGLVERWKKKGEVPYDALLACRRLTPLKTSAKKEWTEEEYEHLIVLKNMGYTYREMAEKMANRFPNMRQYNGQTTVSGALTRLRNWGRIPACAE